MHTSRYTMFAGAGLLSGYVSDAKQLADGTYMSKAPDTFMQLYSKCAAIEMAALVFGFSIAESTLCGVLDFLFEHDPMSLDSLLEKRQVSLAEVWSVQLTELRKQAFAKYRKHFDHLKIEEKASTLLGVLNPPTTTDVVPGFVFQPTTLGEISGRRNTFVHHAELSHFSEINAQVESDLDYLSKSVDFFFELLRKRVYPLSADSGTE